MSFQKNLVSKDDISWSKSLANLQVKSHTQQEVIEFLNDPKLMTSIQAHEGGGVTYTTKYLIIRSYISADNRPSISIQNLSSRKRYRWCWQRYLGLF
jgi:hypothetical protein